MNGTDSLLGGFALEAKTQYKVFSWPQYWNLDFTSGKPMAALPNEIGKNPFRAEA